MSSKAISSTKSGINAAVRGYFHRIGVTTWYSHPIVPGDEPGPYHPGTFLTWQRWKNNAPQAGAAVLAQLRAEIPWLFGTTYDAVAREVAAQKLAQELAAADAAAAARLASGSLTAAERVQLAELLVKDASKSGAALLERVRSIDREAVSSFSSTWTNVIKECLDAFLRAFQAAKDQEIRQWLAEDKQAYAQFLARAHEQGLDVEYGQGLKAEMAAAERAAQAAAQDQRTEAALSAAASAQRWTAGALRQASASVDSITSATAEDSGMGGSAASMLRAGAARLEAADVAGAARQGIARAEQLHQRAQAAVASDSNEREQVRSQLGQLRTGAAAAYASWREAAVGGAGTQWLAQRASAQVQRSAEQSRHAASAALGWAGQASAAVRDEEGYISLEALRRKLAGATSGTAYDISTDPLAWAHRTLQEAQSQARSAARSKIAASSAGSAHPEPEPKQRE